MNECRIFHVKGRVQGVWFRESTRQQAARLGIRGHAINHSNGSVEVLACGEPEALGRLAEWLHRGPPLAQVREVTESDFDGNCPEGFSTG